jgi:vacuolar-type H+-ATPase subunit C/Vma6
VFGAIFSLESFDEVRKGLIRTLRESPLADAFASEPADLATLESAVLRAQLAEQSRAARIAPEGPAPVISFALTLRAEVLNLRRIIWGISLEAPGAMLEAEMVVT